MEPMHLISLETLLAEWPIVVQPITEVKTDVRDYLLWLVSVDPPAKANGKDANQLLLHVRGEFNPAAYGIPNSPLQVTIYRANPESQTDEVLVLKSLCMLDTGLVYADSSTARAAAAAFRRPHLFFLTEGWQKSRLWLYEMPLLPVEASGHLERTAPATGRAKPVCPRVALEWFRPMGGRALYGLLGVEYVAHGGNLITVRVPTSSKHGPKLEWALGNGVDEIRAGLPDEYRESVFSGALTNAQALGLAPGFLTFTMAAFGMVGSSPIMFERLAQAAVGVLLGWHESITEDGIADLLGMEKAK